MATLLKKDGPTQELQKVCTENLVEFLGTGMFIVYDKGFHLICLDRDPDIVNFLILPFIRIV